VSLRVFPRNTIDNLVVVSGKSGKWNWMGKLEAGSAHTQGHGDGHLLTGSFASRCCEKRLESNDFDTGTMKSGNKNSRHVTTAK